MTTGDLLRAIVVRWYVALVGVALTVGAGMAIQAQPGTYESQVDVQFLPPKTFERTANNNPDNDLVAMAGLVEREVNQGAETLQPASADVPLTGMGVKSGTMVTLPNEDGQFDFAFRNPVLRVKAVGPSVAVAERLRTKKVGEIQAVLADIQARDGVPPPDRIGVRQIPKVPPVSLVSGYPTRAAVAAVLLGLLLTAIACVLSDRLVVRHGSSLPRAGGSATSTIA